MQRTFMGMGAQIGKNTFKDRRLLEKGCFLQLKGDAIPNMRAFGCIYWITVSQP